MKRWPDGRASSNPQSDFAARLGIGTVILSALSIVLVAENAKVEPFPRFVPSEALLHIGGGSILIAAWVVTIFFTAYGVTKRKISAAWCFGLAWAVIVLFYLQIVPLGYVSDVRDWVEFRSK